MDPNKLVEKLGEAPLVNLIKEMFNGWSVGGDWVEDQWNFQETLEAIHSLGLSNFFFVWVGEDEKMPTQNILQVKILTYTFCMRVFPLYAIFYQQFRSVKNYGLKHYV
jgi:Peptidase family M13